MPAQDDQDEDGWFGMSARLLAAHDLVRDQGLIAPLDVDDARATRLWQDMDLAIMVEGCFHTPCDPRHLAADDIERNRWLERLGEAHEVPRFRDLDYGRPYWLLRDGQPVGTVHLSTYPRGPRLMPVTSLYVLPEHRGAGIGSAALWALHQAVGDKHAQGIWLDTYWVWQQNVAYYLRRRFWVYMWKRELTFYWARHLPRSYDFEIGPTEARFSIDEGAGPVAFYTARRDGDLLVLVPAERGLVAQAKTEYGLLGAAEGTFALALAHAGWPLYQKEESKAKHWLGDGGNAEGLAPRIRWYEALARHRGWVVETPRVPGIDYQSYEALTEGDDDPLPEPTAEGEEDKSGGSI